MALSGPEAIKSLDDAVRDIRREESEIAKRLSRSAERVGKIREGEAELFRKLAAIRLSPGVQKQIDTRLSNAELEARAVLKAHAAQISATENVLKTLDNEIAALAKARHLALADLDENQEKLKALSSRIADVITQDPSYAGKRAKVDELHAIANQSMKKTEQAEADQEQKGRPYRGDPLFMYLWEAGFNTQSYKANNLVRWLDGLVARLVGYHNARPNFSMLNEIPMRLREHGEAQVSAAEQAEADLDALEEQAIKKAGGAPLSKAIKQAQEKLEQLDADMLKAEDERDKQAHSFGELAEGKDPTFVKAVGDLAQALQTQELSNLISEAKKTSTKRDDTVVNKINDARARAFDETKETDELRERLKVMERRRRELEDIEWEFKKSRFDDPRSEFRQDELVGDLLGEFLRGAITAANYWGQWQRSQSWRADASNWGGGVGLPRGGRSNNRIRKNSSRNSQYNNSTSGRSPWGKLPGTSSNNGFSRPRNTSRSTTRNSSRTGTRGTRKSDRFKTGGGF